MSSITSPRPDVGTTFGALLIGTFFLSALYGLTTHQTYRYYQLYPKDRMSFKVFVATLWILDTVHAAFCMHYSYFYLVVNYFNPAELDRATMTLPLSLIVGIIVAGLTNSFYAWRLHIIGDRNIFLTVIMSILTISRFVFGIVTAVEVSIIRTFSDFDSIGWLVTTTFSLAMATDVVMAIAITFCLYRRRTGHEKTNSTLNTLMMYTINTGLLTSCITVTSLIFCILNPNNCIYLGFNSVLGKLYTNSILAVLNSRRSLQERNAEYHNAPGAFGLGDSQLSRLPQQNGRFAGIAKSTTVNFGNSQSPIDITVTRIEEVKKDTPWNLHDNISDSSSS